jgi:hypothetical protein
MKLVIAPFLVAAVLVSASSFAAEEALDPAAPKSNQERIDSLVQQNQALIEEIKRLRVEAERPKTQEETFAACMQAAKGQTSPMAAESIGEHCDQLLKR